MENNNMMIISNEEYKSLVCKTKQLEDEIDILKMELATYRRSMKQLAHRNLGTKSKKECFGIEIPAGDFADMIDNVTSDCLDDGRDELFEALGRTELLFVWNGFCSSIPWGCEICDEILPAIKNAYEEYNS